jgi:beta-xylosidase/uncharacterized protein YjdB
MPHRVLAAALTAGAIGVAPVHPTVGLVLHYRLDEAAGTIARDSSGYGRDGIVRGKAAWAGSGGLAFDGAGTYIQAPDNLMSGLHSITVATDVILDNAQATPYFLYGFGNGNGSGYLFATGTPYRNSITGTNYAGEQTTKPADGHPLARNTWKHIAYTQSGTTGVLYEDGVEVARNTAVTIAPTAIHGGGTVTDYIGRSLYATDAFFKGRMRDFRVYDRALDAGEVASLADRVNGDMLTADRAALDPGDFGAVTGNLTLPATATNGSAITWQSSDPAVVSAAGVVVRPAQGEPDAHVSLTAQLTRGTRTARKSFRVTVRAEFTDAEAVRNAAGALAVRNLTDVRENLELPTRGPWDTTVAWSSSDPSVIAADGAVRRPPHGAGKSVVTLTATVGKGTAKAVHTFTATVPELPVPEALKGYLFSYFTGEGTATGEQVYFSLSQGDDPLHWQQLNNANPVLTSTLGTAGLRDPFIIRSPAGDKFYQIATDLRIYGNGDWDAAQRSGSKSIMVWESTDLVHWTDQRLVQVAPDTAGNTWAPEAYYDATLGAYVVFWASKLYDPADTAHTGTTYNRMMYATTRDFSTFSEPKVWKDPGYSVIDSTMIEHDGTYYRFTKDERNPSSDSPCSKFVIEEKSTEVRDLDYDLVAECIGSTAMTRGEGPLVFKSNTADKWYLFIDEYGGRGYVPLESTDLDSGVWTPSTDYSLPGKPRHGTVLPVTQAEYDRLLAAYQPDQSVTAVDPVQVWAKTGTAAELPATVTAHYADGSTRDAAVTWGPVGADGTATGSLGPGTTVPAKAVVTVTDGPIPVQSVTVAPASVRLAIGVSRALKPAVLPGNADDKKLIWASSDPSVVRVSETGVLQTLRAGRAVITVRSTVAPRASATVRVEATAAIPADLLLRYEFAETKGSVAADSSGRGNDGAVGGVPAWDGAALLLAGGASTSTTAPYVTIPNGVLAGQDSVTVSTRVRWTPSSTANQWLFGLGPDNGKYLFATPYGGAKLLYSGVTTGGSAGEAKLPGTEALAGGWQHLAVTLDGAAQTAMLYLNGQPVATATGVTIKPSDLYDAAKAYTGYIGKSLYPTDPYFAGAVDDFRVYGRALTAAQVMALAGNTTGITAAESAGSAAPAVITDDRSRIVLRVAEGSDLHSLAPRFTLAAGARISPPPGAVRDFSRPVTYTVTGADGSRRRWSVEAQIMRTPVLPGLFADPNITVFGGTYWIYPTTDGFAGWAGTQFHAFSSTDLVHWTDHGVILDLGPDVTWADDRAWAPTITERNGKYYFYFCAAGNIGVAVADSPAGPFTDALGKPLIAAGAHPGQMIDPATFTDADGTTYLYWGNGHAYVVPLNDDLISFDEAKLNEITPGGFNEGTFVVKRAGTYYLSWSQNDTRSPDYQVAYATGTSPTGPFTPHGLILSKAPELGILGAGHHSIVQAPGTDDWYIAYHRFAIPDGDGTHRETTIDRLRFGPDGLIEPVTPTLGGPAPE